LLLLSSRKFLGTLLRCWLTGPSVAAVCCLQLTSLCIVDDLPRCHTPLALVGLSRLQRCCLCGVDYGAELEAPLSPLPPGPWAASLRSLGAGLDVLARSTEVLATATQLTRLALAGNSLYSKDQAAFWEWAGSHPSLRRLQIEVDEYTDLSGPTLHAICSLARERPQLEVATEMAEGGTTFDKEFDFGFGF